MPITRAEQNTISVAIHAAESSTSGEIVCVLARTSGDYQALPVMWAAVLALALPWLLAAITQWSVMRLLLAQLTLFLVLWLLFSLPSISRRLVPRPIQRQAAHRAAMEQFMVRRVSRTQNRNGILIFVSLTERYARIVADDGISAKLTQPEWQSMVDALVASMKRGEVCKGFLTAVEQCGTALHTHFPARGENPNELPDRLYMI